MILLILSGTIDKTISKNFRQSLFILDTPLRFSIVLVPLRIF